MRLNFLQPEITCPNNALCAINQITCYNAKDKNFNAIA